MKKTVICNIPMKENTHKCKYSSDDRSLPTSDTEVVYPINAFFEKTLTAEDDLKILLLVKTDPYGHYKKNTEDFKAEFLEANKTANAKYEFRVIETEFSEEQTTHEQLMSAIVDEIEEDSIVLADITYGPKDLPIIVFSALAFAEKHLGCEIDHIVYGQANFVDGAPVNTKICDMVALLYMVTVSSKVHAKDAESAKQMLKSLISF